MLGFYKSKRGFLNSKKSILVIFLVMFLCFESSGFFHSNEDRIDVTANFGKILYIVKCRQHGWTVYAKLYTGCSLNIVFFEDFKIYSGLWPLSVSPRCQCVYTVAGQTPALQQNLQSSEKSQHFKEKHNI